MNSKKMNQIADWLLDRVAAGEREEYGSMDWCEFGRNLVTIRKEDDGFVVWLDFYFTPDFTLAEQSTREEIINAIATA